MIGERQHGCADDLAGLVALAGDQQHVAVAEQPHARANGLRPVADLARPGSAGEDLGADGRRRLAPRIVVGYDDMMRMFAGDAAHDRTLALVTVAPAAEHDVEPAGSEGPQRLERRPQRVGLVRVVDDDQRTAHAAGYLEAALDAFELFEGGQHAAGRLTGGNGEAGGEQRVRLPGTRR